MKTNVIFIDNYDSFSYNLVDELKVLGCEVLVYRNDTDVEVIAKIAQDLKEQGQKVIIMLSPGPSAPKDANNLLPIIKDNLGKYPQIGICLGHQALGEVLGGQVIRANTIVHGKASLIEHQGKFCFEGLPNPLRVARYHSLIVKDLPQNVEVLATYDDICMALYEANLKVLGLQFHPESIMSTYGRKILKQALERF
ncbi:MAG: aminodeoxychorismate/anthranilate synthase component II [Succinatimonas sp.]|nr:aminodeoxychorismate/anthranilate synthase component II [Succinatimonas sp.]